MIKDEFDPVFVTASLGGDAFTLIVAMDERLCEDPLACGTQVTDQFSWEVFNPNDEVDVPGVAALVLTNGTNVVITTALPMTIGQVYRVRASDQSGGIGDIYGNVMEFGTFIDTLPTVTLQQNVGGYAGTQDTEPHSLASADSALGANPAINVDNDDNGARSPILTWGPIRDVMSFPDNYGEGVANYLYNCGECRYDHVFLCHETGVTEGLQEVARRLDAMLLRFHSETHIEEITLR